MKNSKVRKYFGVGRKWVFTLALFLLVFAAASVVKIHAAGNVTGWLWGGNEDPTLLGVRGDTDPRCLNRGALGYAPGICIDGDESGVGWVSMSGDNPEAPGGEDYGVTIPSDNGDVTGYAWMNAGGNPDNLLQNGIGAIDFDSQDHCGSAYSAASCNAPDGTGADPVKGGVKRVGTDLIGWARIVEIAKATVAPSNSGGWTGWIKFGNGGVYGSGVDVIKMDGTGDNKMYAWSGATDPAFAGELGWIDFSRAKYTPPCTPVNGGCGGAQYNEYCAGGPAPTPATPDLCNSVSSLVASSISLTEPWKWQCKNTGSCPGTVADCPTISSPSVPGECGSANGSSICNNSGTPEWCKPGSSLVGAPPSTDGYDLTWRCGGTCGGTIDSCSAKGKKSCGWIETNP